MVIRDVKSWQGATAHMRPKGRLISMKNWSPTLRHTRGQLAGSRLPIQLGDVTRVKIAVMACPHYAVHEV